MLYHVTILFLQLKEWLKPIFKYVRHQPLQYVPVSGRSADPVFNVFYETGTVCSKIVNHALDTKK